MYDTIIVIHIVSPYRRNPTFLHKAAVTTSKIVGLNRWLASGSALFPNLGFEAPVNPFYCGQQDCIILNVWLTEQVYDLFQTNETRAL